MSDTDCETQEIGPDQFVSRHVFDFPKYGAQKELIWESLFTLPDSPGDSVVWRKYAATDSDVVFLGREVEALKQAKNKDIRLAGFATAGVGTVLSLEAGKNSFVVDHAPKEGCHHAEIKIKRANDGTAKGLAKVHRQALCVLLTKLFQQQITRLD